MERMMGALWPGLLLISMLIGCQVEAPSTSSNVGSAASDSSELYARLGIETVYLDRVYRYGAGGTLVLDYQPWVLFEDGYALKGIDEPLNDLAPDRHRSDVPERWYTWRIEGEGDQRELVLVDNEGEEIFLKEAELFEAGAVSDDYALSGIWSHVSGAGTDIGNSVVFESTVSFLENGQFTFDRVSATSAEGPVDVADVTADPDRRGRYHLSGFNLELQFDSGEVVTLGFYSWLEEDGSLDTDALGIGGETYLKD